MKYYDLVLALILTSFGFFSFFIFDNLGINESSPFILFGLYYLVSLGALKLTKFIFGKK